MLIYGAGGHGRVLLSTATAAGIIINSIFDDDQNLSELYGTAICRYNDSLFPNDEMVIAIGRNEVREKLSTIIKHPFGCLIHPTALIENNVKMGHGNVVLHRSILQTGVVLGNHIIINTGAIVDHDCHIGDFVHIAPGSVLCGGVSIGCRTLIGARSVVVPNIKIGSNCVIYAGSVVTRNVPDFAVVRGSPAHIIRYK